MKMFSLLLANPAQNEAYLGARTAQVERHAFWQGGVRAGEGLADR